MSSDVKRAIGRPRKHLKESPTKIGQDHTVKSVDDVRCRKGILQFQVSWDHLDLATWEPIESFAPSGIRHWSIKAYLTSEENKQNYKKAVRKYKQHLKDKQAAENLVYDEMENTLSTAGPSSTRRSLSRSPTKSLRNPDLTTPKKHLTDPPTRSSPRKSASSTPSKRDARLASIHRSSPARSLSPKRYIPRVRTAMSLPPSDILTSPEVPATTTVYMMTPVKEEEPEEKKDPPPVKKEEKRKLLKPKIAQDPRKPVKRNMDLRDKNNRIKFRSSLLSKKDRAWRDSSWETDDDDEEGAELSGVSEKEVKKEDEDDDKQSA
ncbi:hypothetical protein GCK72_004020 [Caenorhabditis remanei]|uniref:Chromo domain-containing protein n=1 Tax=Caenorhabditis remanei TaxID=31234 RepID=A0A6A5HB64_CAERE|nr:hypothetical protein GCK72_004020 [Caenorhabditis remanei]KAF1764074.1 hypothetical protein GCK72_004020 [Caenorhabditis remanei]